MGAFLLGWWDWHQHYSLLDFTRGGSPLGDQGALGWWAASLGLGGLSRRWGLVLGPLGRQEGCSLAGLGLSPLWQSFWLLRRCLSGALVALCCLTFSGGLGVSVTGTPRVFTIRHPPQ